MGYYVYRGGSRVGHTASTAYMDVGLTDGTTYSYYVVAYDSSGHHSPPSITVFATPLAAAPASLSPPTIAGSPELSQHLSSSTGSWSNAPTSYAYQWRRCDSTGTSCSTVSGATSSSYVLASADVGSSMEVAVTASNGGGATTADSPPTAVVAQATANTAAPVNTAMPVVSGTTVSGQTLTVSNGFWTNSPTSYAYQWYRCDSAGTNCSAVTGATSSSYLLTSLDVGSTVGVAVTATNAGGSTTADTSSTSIVQAAVQAPVNATLPTISGTAAEGQTLSVANGTWNGSPTGYSYQWNDCDTNGGNCTAISGATRTSYVLAAGDVGRTISASVTASNSDGSTLATSAATTVVTAAAGGGPSYPSCNITTGNISTAASDMAAGTVVCLSAGTYSGTTLSNGGAAGKPAILQATPGARVTITGGLTIGANYETVQGLHLDGSGTTALAVDTNLRGDTIRYDDIYQSTGCGRLVFVGSGGFTQDLTISHNKLHDTDPAFTGCEADAMAVYTGFANVTFTYNDQYDITANDSLCSGGDCHTDNFQTCTTGCAGGLGSPNGVAGGVSCPDGTTGVNLCIAYNWIHDSSHVQGLAFLGNAGNVGGTVVVSDNLEASIGNQQPSGFSMGINGTLKVEHNTYWTGNNALNNITPDYDTYPTDSGSLTFDHNLVEDMAMKYTSTDSAYTFPTIDDRYNWATSAGVGWSANGTGDQVISTSTPIFKCAAAGPSGSNICGNGTAAGDDYELTAASNPNGIGIDWAPANEYYGP